MIFPSFSESPLAPGMDVTAVHAVQSESFRLCAFDFWQSGNLLFPMPLKARLQFCDEPIELVARPCVQFADFAVCQRFFVPLLVKMKYLLVETREEFSDVSRSRP